MAHQFAGETIALCDFGFGKRGEAAGNLKVCTVKTWSERTLIETMFSLLTRVCHSKRLFYRSMRTLDTHLGYLAALFNALVALAVGLHLAQFAF